MSVRVLVVSDEAEADAVLEAQLSRADFEVERVPAGEAAMAVLFGNLRPDLVIIADELADSKGTDLCREIRRSPGVDRIPLIILSTQGDEIERVVALELGADDYITRPYDERELLLRMHALLRRAYSGRRPEREMRAGKLRIDRGAHRAWLGNQELELTQTEFRLLELLMSRRGRAQARDQLLRDVWGRKSEASLRTVDTHVRRLRQKLGSASTCIQTVHGVGYCFRDDDD